MTICYLIINNRSTYPHDFQNTCFETCHFNFIFDSITSILWVFYQFPRPATLSPMLSISFGNVSHQYTNTPKETPLPDFTWKRFTSMYQHTKIDPSSRITHYVRMFHIAIPTYQDRPLFQNYCENVSHHKHLVGLLPVSMPCHFVTHAFDQFWERFTSMYQNTERDPSSRITHYVRMFHIAIPTHQIGPFSRITHYHVRMFHIDIPTHQIDRF